jgi:hypothetical protein
MKGTGRVATKTAGAMGQGYIHGLNCDCGNDPFAGQGICNLRDYSTKKSVARFARNIIHWGGNTNLIGPSGTFRARCAVHARHFFWPRKHLFARAARLALSLCTLLPARHTPSAAAKCYSGPHRRPAPSGIIPTHVCEKGGRCGCCVLCSIWSVSPAERHSSSTSSCPIGCATSHSSEL